MATVTAPPRGSQTPGSGPDDTQRRLPDWLARVPTWGWVGGGLILLMALSAFLRSRYLGGEFWMDEGITTGISLHPVSQIPGILRYDGNPPLYYMMLHVWMSVFGSSESATHALSLVCGVLTIPAGGWAGWKLFGARTGIYAAVLFAFNAWLTAYAQETRMYEFMGLLGVLATAGFLLGFVYRRRRYLLLFAGALTVMLYTHTWGTFFFAGSAVSLIPALIASDDRKGLIRDAAFAFIGAGILYLPWVPTLLYQAANTAAPWDNVPRFGAPILLSRDVIGGDRITMLLIIPAAIGVAPLFTRAHRRSREWVTVWTLVAIPVTTLAIAWLESQVNPAFVARYFAPVIGAILLLIAWGCARAKLLGLVAMVLAVAFLANPSSYTPQWKSDMRDIGAEMTPYLKAGDQVVVGQPEETPLAWYYLPGGLRYANTAGGRVSDPRYMDWVKALRRLTDTDPQATLTPIVDALKPGQHLLFIRPLTEGAQNWEAPWTRMVRRRSAQWGQLLQNDVDHGVLRAVAVAPHYYRGACCVGNSAVLYQKAS
ncbi:MAG TPA: glycosyltransferase family 39 protein [Solirubrobacteraceae bacterium]|nr:glycosyltransferase family 39 protein [Solirubrobacteraceae bacterium]